MNGRLLLLAALWVVAVAVVGALIVVSVRADYGARVGVTVPVESSR